MGGPVGSPESKAEERKETKEKEDVGKVEAAAVKEEAGSSEPVPPPPGITPMYITDETLKRWCMKQSERVGDGMPYKVLTKEAIQTEIKEMGFMCDFHPLRDKVEKFPGAELLLIADRKEKYGQNYYWCSTEATFQQGLEEMRQKEQEQLALTQKEEEDKKAQEDQMVATEVPVEYVDRPIIPRPWISQGSELEIEQAKVKRNRPLLGFTISRTRTELGKPVELTDRNPPKIPEYRRQKIPNYELSRKILEMGFQAAPETFEAGTQTRTFRRVNKAVQSEAISMSEEEKTEVLNSQPLKQFLSSVMEHVEDVLKQNETLDLFRDEFQHFDEEESGAGGNKNENTLKPLHTLKHLRYSEGRNISCIQWHPQNTGVVAFSCMENLTFDAWADVSGQMLTSTILIWNLKDVLTPELILEVPGTLICFSINPDNPNLIAGGLMTGQILLWDVSDIRAAQQNRADGKRGRQGNVPPASPAAGGSTVSSGTTSANGLGNKEEDSSEDSAVAPVTPTLVSHLDRSHSRPVTDIHWLPKETRVKKGGELVQTPNTEYSSMFVSIGGDGNMLFWETQSKEEYYRQREENEGKEAKWVPTYSLPLMRPDLSSTIAPVKMSFGESTKFVTVTEDGEVAFGDWANGKGVTEEAPKTPIQHIHSVHFQACTGVERSPHMPNLYLTCGDWTFSIWREDVEHLGPIFTSPCGNDYLTAAKWSPTRPAVVTTAKRDGSIDVWDLLDQCHKETLKYSVSQVAISNMEFWQSPVSSQQYLAAGDVDGYLHIVEIPRSLRKKLNKEEKLMQNFYERELTRLNAGRGRAANAQSAAAAASGADGAVSDATDSAAATTSTRVEEESKDKDDAERKKQQDLADDDQLEEAYEKLLAKYKSEFADSSSAGPSATKSS